MGMRPGMRAFIGSTLTLLLFFATTLVLADELTKTITARSIANFDDPATNTNWIVQGSRFATKDYPQMTLVKTWPESLYGKNKQNKSLFALGIHGKFDRKGYNFIEIIPAKKGSDGKLTPAAIPIPGRASSIDMWVWGSNYNYTLDAHIRDYQGIDHVLHFGTLMFAGWKNLVAGIPTSIPQARRYIPRYQGLELTKLVLWTAPDEKVDDFFLFIDEVNALTDLFETRFDGESLADVDTLNELWAQGSK
jgi:hypothetical protein